MFKHVLAPPPKKRRPRSLGLLLFVALMIAIATVAFVRDLQRGAARRPAPSDAPVEVILLDEESEEAINR